MEAKELRIGNYVEGIGMEHPIRKIYDSIQYNYKTERYELDDIDIQYFKPIPLTEEWLKKFGFESDEITFDKSGFTIGWFRNNEFYYLPVGQIIIRNKHQIKYVHQLQNLYFALTGEELNKQD